MKQLSLFGDASAYVATATRASVAHARRKDPETSHAAARFLKAETLALIQSRVLLLLSERSRPDWDLIAAYRERWGHAPESSIRTRRSELVDARRVVNTGRRQLSPSGRAGIVWGPAQK